MLEFAADFAYKLHPIVWFTYGQYCIHTICFNFGAPSLNGMGEEIAYGGLETDAHRQRQATLHRGC